MGNIIFGYFVGEPEDTKFFTNEKFVPDATPINASMQCGTKTLYTTKLLKLLRTPDNYPL